MLGFEKATFFALRRLRSTLPRVPRCQVASRCSNGTSFAIRTKQACKAMLGLCEFMIMIDYVLSELCLVVLFFLPFSSLFQPLFVECSNPQSSSFSSSLKTCSWLHLRRGHVSEFNVVPLSKQIWPKTLLLNFWVATGVPSLLNESFGTEPGN